MKSLIAFWFFILLVPIVFGQENFRESSLTAGQKSKLTEAQKLRVKMFEMRSQKRHAEATTLAIDALKISREVLGNKNRETINAILDLAMCCNQQAQYAKAESLYLEALKIAKEILPKKDPLIYLTIVNFSYHYQNQAQYAKAEPLRLEALKILREVKGETGDYSWELNSMAHFYSEQGQYIKAEPLLIEAVKVGLRDPYLLTSLANNYIALGQYAKAELIFVEVLESTKKISGNTSPHTALIINNLGNLYVAQGQNAKAEPLLIDALKTFRKAIGDNHPDFVKYMNNKHAILQQLGGLLRDLGEFYSNQGEYAKAEPLLIEALKNYVEALGDKDPKIVYCINRLGWLYFNQGQHEKAESFLLECLKINNENLGYSHPNTARSSNNLAELYFYQAKHAKAAPLFLKAIEVTNDHLYATSIIQSENAQVQMASRNKSQYLDSFLINALAYPTSSSGYEQVLIWKGMTYRRQNLLRNLQGNGRLKNELSETIRQLAMLLNSTPKPGEDQEFQDKLKALSEKKEKLEKELAKLIPSLNLTKVTPLDLQNLIAPDVALIDILQYGGDYAAWVIRKGKPIARLELGSAEDINNLVFQWRSSLSNRKSPSEGPQDPALALREKVWLPIAKHLEGAKTVIISPDGILGTLPFTALPGEDSKRYLIEERNIAVVPFLQTLPDLLAKKESKGIASLLALGDVAYDVEATSQSNTSRLLAVRGEKGAKWNRLPGTKAEVLSIENSFKKYFPSGRLVELNQNKASEQSVRESAPKSRYLHFATHGFFADETVKAMSVKQDDQKKMMGEKAVVTGENPGLLSGLVLAGANLPPKGNGDDGILTASEVAELDLTGVELAILSACETGLGKTAGGEGIFGLQRAFQLAGARTVVASSWKVPDLSTKELMVRFYGNLWEKKMGKLEALREAQLWVMKEGKAAGLDRGIDDESVVVKETRKEAVKAEGSTKGETLPPKYWAAWILSGAWN